MVYLTVRLRKTFCFENCFCFHHQEKLLRWIHSIDLVCTSGQISLVKVCYFRNSSTFNVNVQFFSIAIFLSSRSRRSFVGSSTFFLSYELYATYVSLYRDCWGTSSIFHQYTSTQTPFEDLIYSFIIFNINIALSFIFNYAFLSSIKIIGKFFFYLSVFI